MCVSMCNFYHPFPLKTENSNANAYSSMEKSFVCRCRQFVSSNVLRPGGVCRSVVEHMPSTCKALGSSPDNAKTITQK